MKQFSIFLCAAATIATLSCKKEVQEVHDPQSGLQPMTFTATTTETRTVLDEDQVSIKWLSTDKISVFDGQGNREFSSNGEGRKVKFTGEAADAQDYVAIYPYNAQATRMGFLVRTSLDAVQPPVNGTFADGLNINAAISADKTTFVFENVMSVAKFTLSADKIDGKTIKSVKFTSSYPLAGDVQVRVSPEGISASAGDNTVNEVTMTDENGLVDGTYYFVVLPNAGGEISMTFETTDGFFARKTATLGKAFTSGTIKNLGTVQGLVWTKVFFYESFDQCSGSGGNDSRWSGSIASNNVVTDNSGWVFENQGGAKECVKLGSGSKKGTATTPTVALAGSVNVAFKAGAWDSSSEKTTLALSAANATISSNTVEMKKAAFTDYDITLSNATASTTMSFAGLNANYSRFFLDEVLIYVGDKALAYELVKKEVAPVIEKELNSTLSISGNIKKQFNVGDSFSFGDGVVKATYSNGEEKVLTVDDVTCSGFNSSTPSDSQTITLTYTEGSNSATGTYNVQIVGTVAGAKYTKVTTLTAGKKYLIVAGNGDSYVMPHPASSAKTLDGVSVDIVNGVIASTTDIDACAFTISQKTVNSVSYYVITFASNGTTYYVAGESDAKTGLKSINAAPTNISSLALWNITTPSSADFGTFNIRDAGATSRSLLWRPSTTEQTWSVFGHYNGTGNATYCNVDLYEYTTE